VKPSSSHPATPSRSSHAARAACLAPWLPAGRPQRAPPVRGSGTQPAAPRREAEAHRLGSCGPPSCTAPAPALQPHQPSQVSRCADTRAPPLERSHRVMHMRTAVATALLNLPQPVSRGGHQHVPLMHSAPPSQQPSSMCPSRSPKEHTRMFHSCTAHRCRDDPPHLAPAGLQRRTPACPSRPPPRYRPRRAGLAAPQLTAPRWAALARGWARWARPAPQFYAAGQQASHRAHAGCTAGTAPGKVQTI